MEEQHTTPTPEGAPRTPEPHNAHPPSVEKEHSALSLVIGALILVIVLILGGLYLWGGSLMMHGDSTANENMEETSAVSTETASDEIEDIDSDLETTLSDLDSELDAELNALDQELDAELNF